MDAARPSNRAGARARPPGARPEAVITRLTASLGPAVVFRGHYRWVVKPARTTSAEQPALMIAIDVDRRPLEARVWSAHPGQSEDCPTVVFPLRDMAQVAGLLAMVRRVEA